MNRYNQIPHPALKTNREITKYLDSQQFTQGTRGKPNEQHFPKQVVIQYLKFTKYVTNIIAEPKYKYGQQEQVTVRRPPVVFLLHYIFLFCVLNYKIGSTR